MKVHCQASGMGLVKPQSTEAIEIFKNTIAPMIARAVSKNCHEPRYEITTPFDSFFISRIFFLDIYFDETVKSKSISLVVKVPEESALVRRNSRFDDCFHNEIVFYTKFAGDFERIPKCVFTLNESSGNSIIALENISKIGYRPSNNEWDLSIEHILAAMRELARFHARGYLLKERRPKEFFENVARLREMKYDYRPNNNVYNFISLWIPQFFRDYVKSRYRGEPQYWGRIESTFNQVMKNVFLDCVEPKEPLAVLCHGDFTRNNILFKDNDVEGNNHKDGLEARLIDFGMVRYASPTIDISTLVHLNCSKEIRRTRLNEILEAYHNALLKYLRKDGVEELDKYSIEAFRNDYKRHAIFGFSIVVFFVPALKAKGLSLDMIHECEPQELCDLIVKCNDKIVFEEIVDEFFELLKAGYLEHIVEKEIA